MLTRPTNDHNLSQHEATADAPLAAAATRKKSVVPCPHYTWIAFNNKSSEQPAPPPCATVFIGHDLLLLLLVLAACRHHHRPPPPRNNHHRFLQPSSAV